MKYIHICNMKQIEPIRQAIAAEQIREAMKKRGLSRKRFAELMGRGPSEVTKWLSGRHNFTIALLQEISDVLETDITAVEDVRALVEGLDAQVEEYVLNDPAPAYGDRADLYHKIRKRSAELGIGARQYIEKLVNEDMENSGTFPEIELSRAGFELVNKFKGIMKIQPSRNELESDERLSRIWNR